MCKSGLLPLVWLDRRQIFIATRTKCLIESLIQCGNGLIKLVNHPDGLTKWFLKNVVITDIWNYLPSVCVPFHSGLLGVKTWSRIREKYALKIDPSGCRCRVWWRFLTESGQICTHGLSMEVLCFTISRGTESIGLSVTWLYQSFGMAM